MRECWDRYVAERMWRRGKRTQITNKKNYNQFKIIIGLTISYMRSDFRIKSLKNMFIHITFFWLLLPLRSCVHPKKSRNVTEQETNAIANAFSHIIVGKMLARPGQRCNVSMYSMMEFSRTLCIKGVENNVMIVLFCSVLFQKPIL